MRTRPNGGTIAGAGEPCDGWMISDVRGGCGNDSSSSALAKEFLHQCGAFVFEDAAGEEGFWVEGPVGCMDGGGWIGV